MKLVYDGQIFSIQRAGGINRYFAEIIARLPKEWHPCIIGTSDLGANAPQHPNLTVHDGPFFRPRRLAHRFRKLRWRNLLKGASLLHPTYYEVAEGIELREVRCPVIITVYDMIFANYPDLIAGADEFVRAQRDAVIRADHIVCISRATEQDLLERCPQATGKTSVIYLGSSFGDESKPPDRKPDAAPSFLYVGARGKYKNFSFLLRSFAAASQSCKHMRLHIAGPPLEEQERWEIYLLGIADRVSVDVFPTEAVLRDLYRNSVALLYPSRHEGFGIPPLEAMSCGTIPVTANTTSLPEVLGQGGIMLDPTDQAQWSDCILQLARGLPNKKELIARGLEQAKRFSWEEAAAQHVQLYERLHN